MSEKKPRLFYWEEAADAYVPAPDQVENIIDVESLDDGDGWDIRFRRFDMTDAEYENLPEGKN